MEVPVINRFAGLESGMSSLPNPTFFPRFLGSSGPGFETLSQSLDLWKWSAVIIAVLATFSGVINRVKILFVIFQRQKRILQEIVDDSDSGSDGEFSVDDTASSVSSSWSEFEEDDVPATSSPTWDLSDLDFRVRGSDYYLTDLGRKRTLRLRQRRSFRDQNGDGDQFSWADFGGGKSVVKLWENLRLEADHRQSDANEIRVYDVIKEQKICSIFAGKSQIASTSRVLLSAGADVPGKVTLNLWDTRVGSQIPALIAEWKPVAGKVFGVHLADDQKVYIRDEDGGMITVGDVRKVKSPLENSTAGEVETWWDADAVLVSAE